MGEVKYPGWYSFIKEKHPNFIKALEQLGEAVRQEGPLDDKTAHLVQLAGAGQPFGGRSSQPYPQSLKGRGDPGRDLPRRHPAHQHHRLPPYVRGLELGL